jgi:hypothetical protein
MKLIFSDPEGLVKWLNQPVRFEHDVLQGVEKPLDAGGPDAARAEFREAIIKALPTESRAAMVDAPSLADTFFKLSSEMAVQIADIQDQGSEVDLGALMSETLLHFHRAKSTTARFIADQEAIDMMTRQNILETRHRQSTLDGQIIRIGHDESRKWFRGIPVVGELT